MVDELYLQYLGVLPSSNDEPEEPEEDPDSSYVSSYVSVYVKPDPKPPASKPSNTGGISLPPPPVRPPASKPSNTGGISLPPPPRYDPRPDSQKPGGKPAKKTIIPLPRPNVDIPLVAYTSGDIHKARDIENRYQDLIQDHLLPDDIDYQEAQAAFERADVHRLSDEQQLRIDYLLGTEDDPLTRSMLLAIKHEGIPSHLTFDEYMTRFADWGLVEESDRRAWQVMQSNIKDVTNDNWESARAIDLNSGEEVFLRAGSKDSVLLQDEQKRMLEGRDIALIHNHPNNSPASNADLSAAIDLGVMFLVLVTPAGLQYHYRRYGDEMKLVEVIHNSDYVALSSAEEDEESRAAYEAQLLAEAGNPAEWVMRQYVKDEVISVNTDSRLVREFFLDPATIVFLEDVANEYEVEDPSLHNATVLTIIYRELRGRFGLANADNPDYQHRWDWVKSMGNLLPYIFSFEIGKFDGDPSLGIGALSRRAALNIERDAAELNMNIYAPLLGFDTVTPFDEISIPQTTERIKVKQQSQEYPIEFTLFSPTNEEYGAWRMGLYEFGILNSGRLQETYESTLGYIAAEVAIAMTLPEYQKLGTEGERIAFLIGNHANRSAKPGAHLYDPKEFSATTMEEIRWVEDFQGLIHDVRNEIQVGAQVE